MHLCRHVTKRNCTYMYIISKQPKLYPILSLNCLLIPMAYFWVNTSVKALSKVFSKHWSITNSHLLNAAMVKRQINLNLHRCIQHCHTQHRMCRNHLIGLLSHQASPCCQSNSWTRYISGSMWISCRPAGTNKLTWSFYPIAILPHDSSSSQDASLFITRKGI